MNEGIVQSSAVQQMAAAGTPNWWSINNNIQRSLPIHHQHYHSALPPPPLLTATHSDQDLPHSWSHLVLGLVGEEDKRGVSHIHVQPKNYVENREQQQQQQQLQYHTNSNSSGADHVLKQENSTTSLKFCFSDKSSECNSSVTGGAAKKARINSPSWAQSGIKVRKEKLGDRITALHQLVSPFGKTDTASVLLEAVGYIRFLQRQIEALSLPYVGSTGAGNMNSQQPECDGDEANKDLKSRGLCLVPLSCTVDVGSADYWATFSFQ